MHLVDWLIVVIPLIIVAVVGLRAQRYVRGVSDFLAAGRVAGRYVVAVANGEAAMGLISVVAMFEMYYKSGFAISFWNNIGIPIMLVIMLTGFAIYRFRETRAMTLAQFFEIRYSKSFRVFAGVLQAISGILNYGLFPAVGARFIMYFCDLPTTINFIGLSWPTFGLLMAIFLGIAVLIVTIGGQITVMTTDCIQGILSYPMYLIVVFAIIMNFSWWNQIGPTLMDRPVGESILNPFDTFNLKDFNIFYIVVGIIGNVFNILSWSGTQGYNAAAATPHEQKMGRILGAWRTGFSVLMFVLLAAAAYTYMNNAEFAKQASQTERNLSWKAVQDVSNGKKFQEVRHEVHEYLQTDQIVPSLQIKLDKVRTEEAESARKIGKAQGEVEKILNPQDPSTATIIATALKAQDKGKARTFTTIHNQMRVPVALRDLLPIGVTGVFCAIMIFLMISTDTTYLHSWGSILVQDIVLPFRKKPFTPRQQLFWLRVAIAFVAVFAFFFSLYFGQVTFILMFFALTGSIWLGGAGAVILGGLYWKRGTTQGAWAGLLSGSILASIGFIGQNYWAQSIYPMIEKSPTILHWFTIIIEGISHPFEPIIQWRVTPDKFPINGQEVYFLTMLLSIATYVTVSLLTCRKPFNMERMLHRGKYRREDDRAPGEVAGKPPRSLKGLLQTLLGIDAQFTRGDKILSWSVFLYSMVWGFGSWLVVLIWNVIKEGGWPKQWWSTWFFIQYFVVAFIVGLVTTVWFTIGGTWDLRRMFKRLASHETNILDDGRVVGHVSADDVALVEKVEHIKIEEERHEDMQ